MGASVNFRRNLKFIYSKYMTTEDPVNLFFKDETQLLQRMERSSEDHKQEIFLLHYNIIVGASRFNCITELQIKALAENNYHSGLSK